MLLAARLVLLLHVAFVVFVVLGLVLFVSGWVLDWRWVRSPGLRRAHLAAVGFVVLRSWCGAPCFLTSAESWLRERAGTSGTPSEIDVIGESVVLRGTDPIRFRKEATAWGALTLAAFALGTFRSAKYGVAQLVLRRKVRTGHDRIKSR